MMNAPAQSFNRVLAFEVAKDSLVVHALPADRQCAIANRPAAVRRVLRAAVLSRFRHEVLARTTPRLGTLA